MNKENENQEWLRPALMMFARLAGWVVGPILIASAIGMFIDKKNESEPWGLLCAVGIAFIVSIFGIIKNAVEEFRKLEKINNKEKK